MTGTNGYLSHALFITLHHTLRPSIPRKANIPGYLQQRWVSSYNYDDLIHDIKKRLQECHEIARSNLMQTRQRRLKNQKNKVYVPIFHAGYVVLIKNEKSGKLDPLSLGHYKVKEIHKKGSNAVIELTKKKRQKVHIKRLKTYLSLFQDVEGHEAEMVAHNR